VSDAAKMMALIERCRATHDPTGLAEALPYSSFLGFSLRMEGEELIAKMAFSEKLIGNAMLPALHGGTVGALLESTAALTTLLRVETLRVPKTVNITFDFLRSARPVDTFAVADMTRLGKRVASVRALAWQEDRSKPIAVANGHFLLVPADEEHPTAAYTSPGSK
jgi:uncharacterized protein (TIGR00369 family)